MKRYNNIFLAALFGATLLLGGCREEEKIADDLYIPGLGGEKYAENELDKWLYQNYTLPYNIDVVYRWDAAQAYSSLSEVQLVPVEFDAVQPMMAALRDVWFEPYIQATGNSQDFLKEVAPKKIVLVGSPEYQNGSYTLGQAEGGRKILLLNVNNFDASDENELKESLHTIVHEFTHILHQTKLFDKKYQEISTGRYNSNWTLLKDPEARRLGFITSIRDAEQGRGFRRDGFGHSGLRLRLVQGYRAGRSGEIDRESQRESRSGSEAGHRRKLFQGDVEHRVLR